MDAVVVLLGCLDAINVGSYTALRAVRVLRPLRTITRVPGLRVSRSKQFFSTACLKSRHANVCYLK